MKISPARTAAFDILQRIETEQAFSSVLLPIYEAELSPADRGLCHELVLGVLRRQIYLDRVIDSFADGKRLDVEVRIALRLAFYQLYYLDRVPQYSAINESVNLVQRAKKTSAKGFVNAILRRATREKIELRFVDEMERISVETSHPRWLFEKWISEFGMEGAVQLATANNDVPTTAFRRIGEPNDQVQKLIATSRRSEFVDDCFVANDPGQKLFSNAESGLIYIQDEASQMVAQAIEIPDGGAFLDVCAAPGGKTGMIAGRNSASAKLIVAGDLHWPRVEYLRDNCRRQGADNVKVIQHDAEKGLPCDDEIFDVVLVDAPCSGTGTIRHNPEIRYFLTQADLSKLYVKQLGILTNASKLVRFGGLVVYSTCSLEVEENENVCRKFLAENVNFRTIRPNVPQKFIMDEGFARTWPHRDNLDGFFIAAFKRN